MMADMKQKFKKYLPLAIWILVAAITITSVAFVNMQSSNTVCKELQIKIVDSDQKGFIDNSDVINILRESDKFPTGKNIVDINTALLETILETNPYIENAEVFSTLDGVLHVEVSQREPIIRIFNANNECFYIDEKGHSMPVSDKFSMNVITANGYINDNAASTKIKMINDTEADTLKQIKTVDQLFYIASSIKNDTLWNAQLVQMYVNSKNEIELVPRVGNHIILLGGVNNLREKFDKLLIFYRKGLNKKGWTDYAAINLSYKGQVVALKRTPIVTAKADTTISN